MVGGRSEWWVGGVNGGWEEWVVGGRSEWWVEGVNGGWEEWVVMKMDYGN